MKRKQLFSLFLYLIFCLNCNPDKSIIKIEENQFWSRSFAQNYKFEKNTTFYLNDGEISISYYKNGNLKDIYMYNDDIDRKLLFSKQYDSIGNLLLQENYNWNTGNHYRKYRINEKDSIIIFKQKNPDSEIFY